MVLNGKLSAPVLSQSDEIGGYIVHLITVASHMVLNGKLKVLELASF